LERYKCIILAVNLQGEWRGALGESDEKHSLVPKNYPRFILGHTKAGRYTRKKLIFERFNVDKFDCLGELFCGHLLNLKR
jgi:hypothetical protein